MILVPEKPFNIEDVCSCINERKQTGKNYSIIVVAEGAKPVEADTFETVSDEIDEFGNVRLGGIGNTLAKEVEKRTGFESRAVILGHTQRGGTPTAFDRVLSTRYGIAAIDMVKNGEFGKMTALRGSKIVPVDLKEAVEKNRTVDMELYEIAKVFFG